jgi:hypothetical protein
MRLGTEVNWFTLDLATISGEAAVLSRPPM